MNHDRIAFIACGVLVGVIGTGIVKVLTSIGKQERGV